VNTRVVITIVIALLAPGRAWADEIPMNHGHFVGEKIFILALTSEQVMVLDQRRKPGQRLYRVPLALNRKQMDEMAQSSAKRIKQLWIFEGNWTDCACRAYNIASRIEKNVLEVPTSYLLTEAEIAKRQSESRR
jgi:hypothetical protein